jgi:hydroxymethylbilane synthase
MERRKVVRMGTRGSALARRQTDLMREAIERAHPDVEIRVEVIETVGDRVRDQPISKLGDKGVFVRAIEARLLNGSIDLAVHSLKDVPSDVTVPGLSLAAFSPREDPREVVISAEGQTLAELPPGATVGTSSPRRRALLAAVRPDLVPQDIRGNVDTRLRKVREGNYAAIILAAAGLHRLGLAGEITEYLPLEDWLPDAGQGIMTVQGREGDEATTLAQAADCRDSRLAALAERAVARALGADCHSPIGALARIDGETLALKAVAARDDLGGLQLDELAGPLGEAERIGLQVGQRLASLLGKTGVYTEP